MATKEIKTTIDGLKPGMYVSRLEKPWVDINFPIDGMPINDDQDIARLRSACNYVVVDVEKGGSPDVQHWVMNSPRPKATKPIPDIAENYQNQEPTEFDLLRKTTYHDTRGFTEEILHAEKIYDQLNQDIRTLLEDLEQNRDLDLHRVKDGVNAMIDSVMRNPSALLWVNQIKRTDSYSYNHALTTSVWCATFGRHLGLDRHDIEYLATGGMLLDVGKTKLPPQLFNKQTALSNNEYKLIQTHVAQSVNILKKAGLTDEPVLKMVASHHERSDGSGYPLGLMQDEIPLFARIAGVVDSYEAMTSDRPHGIKALPPHGAMSELYEQRGKTFQAELVEHFITTLGLYPTGTLVELNSGEVAAVIAVNGLRRLRPKVILLLDDNKAPREEFITVDLSENKKLSVKRGLPRGAFGINMDELFL